MEILTCFSFEKISSQDTPNFYQEKETYFRRKKYEIVRFNKRSKLKISWLPKWKQTGNHNCFVFFNLFSLFYFWHVFKQILNVDSKCSWKETYCHFCVSSHVWCMFFSHVGNKVRVSEGFWFTAGSIRLNVLMWRQEVQRAAACEELIWALSLVTDCCLLSGQL